MSELYPNHDLVPDPELIDTAEANFATCRTKIVLDKNSLARTTNPTLHQVPPDKSASMSWRSRHNCFVLQTV